VGAGNFQSTYIREGRSGETPRQAHSIVLQLLAETGIVGALLGLVAVGAVAVAMVRYLRSGPLRDPAFAGGIAAMGAWVAHASIDWLWQIPVVTLPVVLLAGGLVAYRFGYAKKWIERFTPHAADASSH
jgi:O-antigen ligase